MPNLNWSYIPILVVLVCILLMGILVSFFPVGFLGRHKDDKALALQALIAYICIINHSILSKVTTTIVEHTLIKEHVNSS